MTDWYYIEQGGQKGPVSEADFHALVATGRIGDDTLVWRSGMADWTPWREVASAQARPGMLPQIPRGPTTSWPQPASAGALTYGGFWIRFLAKVLDRIILIGINTIIQLPFAPIDMKELEQNPSLMLMILTSISLLSAAVECLYVTLFLGRYGATPGKMALKLRVVTPDGRPVSYWRAFARYWAEMLSGCICMIGYIIAAFDAEKRALHDHICSTRVVKVE
ncbi:MAG: hypothetical protein Kow0059_12800 [Candidatus Sumerlaeia bacterium]